MTNDSKPHIIAHRGESFNAPENTLAAINLAWERGAEAVEIDIQFSKDRELVVIHDTDTKRLAGIDKKSRRSNIGRTQEAGCGSLEGYSI
jgi:glycerophosphoryl diester phosphodiesterase